jgi:hypothetical protein
MTAEWLRFRFRRKPSPVTTANKDVVATTTVEWLYEPTDGRRGDFVGTRLVLDTPHGEPILSVHQQGSAVEEGTAFWLRDADDEPLGVVTPPWIYLREQPVGRVDNTNSFRFMHNLTELIGNEGDVLASWTIQRWGYEVTFANELAAVLRKLVIAAVYADSFPGASRDGLFSDGL